uniref:Uncharacterized protein n=1 Tax=Rhizophora mucronata TaxID=61149 RepID=A0A2P2Q4D7_RHIMU
MIHMSVNKSSRHKAKLTQEYSATSTFRELDINFNILMTSEFPLKRTPHPGF